MTTLASPSLSRHSWSKEPTWLAHALTVFLGFESGFHMHIAQFVIATLGAVLEPKIRLSHRRLGIEPPFVYQGFNTHIRESKRH